MNNTLDFIDKSRHNVGLHKLLALLSAGLLLFAVFEIQDESKLQSELVKKLNQLKKANQGDMISPARTETEIVRAKQFELMIQELRVPWAPAFVALESAKLKGARIDSVNWLAQDQTLSIDYLLHSPDDTQRLTDRLVMAGLKDVRLVSRQQVAVDLASEFRLKINTRWPAAFTEKEQLAQSEYVKALGAK